MSAITQILFGRVLTSADKKIKVRLEKLEAVENFISQI